MKNPIDVDLSNKVAVVTGAGGVLCSMFAKAIARCGAKVVLLDRTLEKAQKHAEEIVSDGYTAKAFQCNVLDKETLEQVRAKVNSELGTCDILINGAGGNKPLATTTNEYYFSGDFDKSDLVTFFNLDTKSVELVFNLNFIGTLIPTQVFAPDMLNKEDASIINISSMNAFTPLTKIPAYSGAKAAISNFTQWLAVHFSKTNIRVNAIAPGFFSTKQNASLLFNPDGTPTERTGKILNSTPMGRFGEPEELIGALLFLLYKPASSFVTGVVLPVDGGFSSYSGV
ncbi:SDR family oxidoreductase [Ruminiclostridium cellulolyticum]|uniref:Short-chain dehydrogenase/reductase SDR n=1 Tax=Ruminiclostridium cellulolyticum (strain ATCC 35319 / DSM 5812 / JCM 6584 / H10) TaxID=394503 RepID=B8I2N1_RUMCH|nr:SDR family oxidoreductase [Ruminiclostridium cellulolyticum]ACL76024.1 short-chain dehydrogenase/reductase SDR [Ruminiclostridium cellulolyticum H10]